MRKIFVIVKLSGLFCLLLCSCKPSSEAEQKILSLSGTWECAIDSLSSAPEQLNLNYTVTLPGTLDEASIGNKLKFEPEMQRQTFAGLFRKYYWVGKAWYRKTIIIPDDVKGMTALLVMERVIWRSTLYLDGRKIGSESSLSVPHVYDLTSHLSPGQHEILICIDNSRQYSTGGSTYKSEWNGVLGDFMISFYDKSYINNTAIFADAENRKIRIRLDGSFTDNGNDKIQFTVRKKTNGKILCKSSQDIKPSNEYLLTFTSEPELWDEFNPVIYTLETSVMKNGKQVHTRKEDFGFRTISVENRQMVLNDRPIYLRGSLSIKFLPPSDYTIVDPAVWKKIFRMAKAYGMNHMRFHSNCPPAAAFEAADELGLYLEVESPNWSLNFGQDSSVVDFIKSENEKLIAEYGNHPSFCLMTLGNEIEGDFDLMNRMVSDLRKKDNRFLYATTGFTFQKGHGRFPEPEDEFFITQYTDSGWVRGQGIFDVEYPSYNKDYNHAVSHIPVPLIIHEMGQHAVYPDLNDIDKHTGVLFPGNLITIRKDLLYKGLADITGSYVNASGRLQVMLYKEEIERALKSTGVSGFQLLAMNDWPANSAFVGMLNIFYEPKSYIDSTEFRQFCSEVVPLIWLDKPVYKNNETLTFEIGVSNYFKPFKNNNLICELSDSSGNTMQEKIIVVKEILNGRTEKYGKISFSLAQIEKPLQLKLSLKIDGTGYLNSWPVWVYPESLPAETEKVLVTDSFGEAEKALDAGKNVLLSPPPEQLKGFPGKFKPVFWSPTHFSFWETTCREGTMGLLIENEHPAFSAFPTEYHSNWQWWDLCKKSVTVSFDSLDVDPLVRVIDNYFMNRRLTNLFEVKSGSGKLIFSSIDLISDLDNRTEARQLRHSLIDYMTGNKFNPEKVVDFPEIRKNLKNL